MDTRDWVLRDHESLVRTVEANILDVVPAADLAHRPVGVANSILWSLWHSARTEDLVVNVLARGTRQLVETCSA